MLTKSLSRALVSRVYALITKQAKNLKFPLKEREMKLVLDHIELLMENHLRNVVEMGNVDETWRLVQRTAGLRHIMSLRTLIEHQVRSNAMP
jgi:hypothetical protein